MQSATCLPRWSVSGWRSCVACHLQRHFSEADVCPELDVWLPNVRDKMFSRIRCVTGTRCGADIRKTHVTGPAQWVSMKCLVTVFVQWLSSRACPEPKFEQENPTICLIVMRELGFYERISPNVCLFSSIVTMVVQKELVGIVYYIIIIF